MESVTGKESKMLGHNLSPREVFIHEKSFMFTSKVYLCLVMSSLLLRRDCWALALGETAGVEQARLAGVQVLIQLLLDHLLIVA